MTNRKETKQSIVFKESLNRLNSTNTLTAIGTTESDALLISKAKTVHIITAGAANTGVKLPSASASGSVLFIKNFTNTAKKLYVTGADTIDDITDNSGLTITANAGIVVIDALTTAWVSF